MRNSVSWLDKRILIHFINMFLLPGSLLAGDAMSFSSDREVFPEHENAICGPYCDCGCLQGGVCQCGMQNDAQGGNQPFRSWSAPVEVDEKEAANIGCLGHGDAKVCSRYHDRSLQTAEYCDSDGIWLPEDPPLFRPFMADPREVCYSVGWRFNDNALTKNVIDVSFGDTLPIYRWCDRWPWHGQLQIEIEGAVWAVFDPCTESAPLINADYYVGFPLSYAIDRWQFRLRPYHISCHLGDEFLLNHPGFDRRNASNEFIDFFISHDLTPELRFYGGIGYILREDESFKIKRYFSAIGAELRLMHLGFYDEKDCLAGYPIFAMHFRQNGEFKKHVDATYILGYQIAKECGLCRNLRFFIEYHDGYSVEGQFWKVPTNYFAIRSSYGF